MGQIIYREYVVFRGSDISCSQATSSLCPSILTSESRVGTVSCYHTALPVTSWDETVRHVRSSLDDSRVRFCANQLVKFRSCARLGTRPFADGTGNLSLGGEGRGV